MFDQSRRRRRAASLAWMRVHSDIRRRRLIHRLRLLLLLVLLHTFQLLLPRLLLLLRLPVKVIHGEVSLFVKGDL